MIDRETYLRERAICDKADAYWKAHATYARSGASSMSAKLADHPDLRACNNAMRGRVEQYELLTDTPERFVAYVGKLLARTDSAYGLGHRDLTTWTGDVLGTVQLGCGWRVDSYIGSRMYQAYATVNGREFTGRTFGEGTSIVLRETAASKRK